MGVNRADAVLSARRASFKKDVETALASVGVNHPAAKHLRATFRALDRRPPTKRERALVGAVVPNGKYIDPNADSVHKMAKAVGDALTHAWNTPCIRCRGMSSKILTIIIGFPVCDSCHPMFERGFENLTSDLDIEFGEPRVPSRDIDPMGIADEDFDIDI